MKKLLIIIMLIPILTACKTSNFNKNDCQENMYFKKTFFRHIKYIEKNISVLQDSTFIKSVIFISNYAPVSTNEIMNYSRTYPLGVFEKDYKKWIEWYNKNKCNNIQLKTKYVIPEVYIDIYESYELE